MPAARARAPTSQMAPVGHWLRTLAAKAMQKDWPFSMFRPGAAASAAPGTHAPRAEPTPEEGAPGAAPHHPTAFAYSVVHASGAPLLLLDDDLRVVAASGGYLHAFHDAMPEGKRLDEITGGAWTEAQVQQLLDQVRHGGAGGAIDAQVLCPEGLRLVRVRIEAAMPGGGDASALVISVEDRTDQIARDAAQAAQLQESVALLRETQHRTANNLAIICSILTMKARVAHSEETRVELASTLRRVLAMAAIERHLQYTDANAATPMDAFLQALCAQLQTSLLGDGRAIQLIVRAGPGSQPRRTAVILGLAITELVINALKHAFPGAGAGEIRVEYDELEDGWRASVSDNGAGLGAREPDAGHGSGLDIISALATQVNAEVRVADGPGVRVELRKKAARGPLAPQG
jgi:two-component sensor histidine kinase